MRIGHRWLGAVGAGICIVGIGLTAAGADAPPAGSGPSGASGSSGLTPDVVARMVAQNPLTELAGEFRALGSPGFASSIIDSPPGSVTIYWYGPVPAAAAALEAKAARSHIDLRIRSARFSEAQLNAAADQILTAGLPAGITVVEFNPDSSGLSVAFGTDADRQAALAAVAAIRRGVTTVPGVHLRAPLETYAVLTNPPGRVAVSIAPTLSNVVPLIAHP